MARLCPAAPDPRAHQEKRSTFPGAAASLETRFDGATWIDPPGLREKAEYLLREWVNLYHSAAAGRDSTKAFSAFVGQVELLERKVLFIQHK